MKKTQRWLCLLLVLCLLLSVMPVAAMAARRAASLSDSCERITVSPFVWEEDTFSTENVRRIVSLMCASHMEHAMPEIFTVV